MWILRNHKTEPFCWGLWILACYHISCHSSPNFLKKGRSAVSLLHCLPAQANSVISLSILYYPSSDFIVFYPFNSIATACGCEWGEGASSDLGDWLCYLCAGAAAAPFVPCYSTASAPAQGCSGEYQTLRKRTVNVTGRVSSCQVHEWLSNACLCSFSCFQHRAVPLTALAFREKVTWRVILVLSYCK